MKQVTWLCALSALAGLSVSAEEFSLTYKTIPAGDVMAFPGGYGSYAQVRASKPAAINKEPRAISKHPLYGDFRGSPSEMNLAFRLDESAGDGKGYDQIIVDLNGNGDLSDDAAVQQVKQLDRGGTVRPPQQVLFGPIELKTQKTFAGGKPVFVAQVYLYNLSILRESGRSRELSERLTSIQVGQARFKPAWYLETTVELDGVKRKMGLYDGDGNGRLGDVSKGSTSRSGMEESFYFSAGDSWLIDENDSGKFENSALQNESSAFGPVFYFGVKPWKTALDTANAKVKFEPWTGPLAEVTLSPRGAQVQRLVLAQALPEGGWGQLTPGVKEGKISVPTGEYRLNACTLAGKGSEGPVMASGYDRKPRKPVRFEAGKANTLECGGPLTIKVEAEKRKPQPYEAVRPEKTARDSDFILSINATVNGAGNEVYSSYARGEKFQDRPPAPTFTILDAKGAKVANGNLEFG